MVEAQNKKGILPVATLMRPNWRFRGRGVFIDAYKVDNKIASSGATLLADIHLGRTYRAIDSVATARIPSLFCGNM